MQWMFRVHDRAEYTAWIGLGSNVPSKAGDRRATLLSAVESLRALGKVAAVSSFHATAPVGFIDQPEFLNGAATLETSLAPEDLLQQLLQIERAHGRDRSAQPPKGPRTLDLDLLLMERDGLAIVQETASLTLPHPAMHERRFVLAPLAEIAALVVHPLQKKTIAELLASLS